jgi:HEAT repeat protein
LTEKKKRDEKMFGKTKKLLDHSDMEKMREKKDVKGLIKALGSEQSLDMHDRAAVALGFIGDRSAVGPLIKALTDESTAVRRDAAMALGRIGDNRAVEPLKKALNDANSGVREGAANALKKIGDRSQ